MSFSSMIFCITPIRIDWLSSFSRQPIIGMPSSIIFYLSTHLKYGIIAYTNANFTVEADSLFASFAAFSTYWKNTVQFCWGDSLAASSGSLMKAMALTSAS